jgi:hypothetical protein
MLQFGVCIKKQYVAYNKSLEPTERGVLSLSLAHSRKSPLPQLCARKMAGSNASGLLQWPKGTWAQRAGLASTLSSAQFQRYAGI